MRQILKNAFQIILFFLIGVAISLLMTENEVPLLLDDEFLITFTGVVLGIASTIVTFIFSSTDKVLNVLENTYTTSEITSDVFEIFKSGYAELVQDSNFIFIIFLLFLVTAGWSAIDIPYVSMPIMFPKPLVLNAIKMGLFVNCLFATADLFFSLSNILKLALYEHAK